MSDEFDAEEEWNDWDEGDEKGQDEDEYENAYVPQEQDIQGVYRDQERAGIVQDEDIEIPVGENVKLDPDLKFKLDVKHLLDDRRLEFTLGDQKNIKSVIRHLSFLEYRSALLYVLGYYFYKRIRVAKHKWTDSCPEKRVLEGFLQREGQQYTLTQVVRYARFWEKDLRKRIDFI